MNERNDDRGNDNNNDDGGIPSGQSRHDGSGSEHSPFDGFAGGTATRTDGEGNSHGGGDSGVKDASLRDDVRRDSKPSGGADDLPPGYYYDRGGKLRKRRATTQEKSDRVGRISSGSPLPITLADIDANEAPKGLKLRDMLSSVFYHGCGVIASIPRLRPMGLSPQEASRLGQAWSYYLESVPSRKRGAAVKLIQTIAPITIALGATAMIFVPRLLGVPGQLRGLPAPPGSPGFVPPREIPFQTEGEFKLPTTGYPPPSSEGLPGAVVTVFRPPGAGESTAPNPNRGAAGGMSAEQYDTTLEGADDFDDMLDAGMGL